MGGLFTLIYRSSIKTRIVFISCSFVLIIINCLRLIEGNKVYLFDLLMGVLGIIVGQLFTNKLLSNKLEMAVEKYQGYKYLLSLSVYFVVSVVIMIVI